MHYKGKVRVYFNRHSVTEDRYWCVEAADAEIAVKEVRVLGAHLTTKYAQQPKVEGHEGAPSAWLEGEVTLSVAYGVAYLYPPGPP